MYRVLGGSRRWRLSLARFVAAALLLLMPTTLMGATLPLLSRHFVAPTTATSVAGTVGRALRHQHLRRRRRHLRRRLRAPARRSASAPPTTPPPRTNLLARGRGLAGAPAPVAPRRRRARRRPRSRPTRPPPPIFDADAAASAAWRSSPSPLSGAVAMVDQVLWTRALAIVIGSSVYSFTLILLAFLVGLAGGAALLSRLTARTPPPDGVAGRRAPRHRGDDRPVLPASWTSCPRRSSAFCAAAPSPSTASSSASSCSPRWRCCRRRCAWAASCR